MNFIEQITAVLLLVDFLFGVAFGVVGGAVIGSRRGALLWPAADGLLSAGARVVHGVYTRDDDGYLRYLQGGPAPGRRGTGEPGSHGKGPGR